MASWLFKNKPLLGRSNSDNRKGFGSTRLFALRQSRWFTKEDSNLFQNVVDSGYILELRKAQNKDGRNVDKDAEATLEYGIVLWIDKPEGQEKQAMVVHLGAPVGKSKKSPREIKYVPLQEFWLDQTEIRINNMGDGDQKVDSPEDIVDRVNRAFRGSYKCQDSLRFVHWCRYGNPTPAEEKLSTRRRQMSDAVICWGSISASAGALFYTTRRQRKST